MSVTPAPVSTRATRSPMAARLMSIIPGAGQLFYGAPLRALQYLLGVLGCFAGAAVSYDLSYELARVGLNPVLTSIGFLVSELVALSFVVAAISHWIAASWDARQGTIARNEGAEYRPTWWFVKLKQFLFDEPEEEGRR